MRRSRESVCANDRYYRHLLREPLPAGDLQLIFSITPQAPDIDKMIRDFGADIILGTSNSTKSMVDSIQGLRPDGRLLTMGADAEPLSISLMDLIAKRIRNWQPAKRPKYLYEALDFVAQGKVKTIVETYPLAEAPKAYQRVVDGKARFHAVLSM